MATDTTVNNLIINKLTKAQYDAIESPSETELYLVPDEIDTTPTSGSENPVTSGGVYTALSGKADSSSLSTVATSGSYTDLSDKPVLKTDNSTKQNTSASETISCELNGEQIRIAFKGSFLEQSIQNVLTEKVKLLMSEPSRACVIKPFVEQENTEYLSLLMPMQLNN
jgi:hypothetical protein